MTEKEEPGRPIHKEVTSREFMHLLMEDGLSQVQAQFQLTVAKGLGSSVRIGNFLVSVNDKE